MLQLLLSTEPWLLFGGLNPGPGAQELLVTFWRLFKVEHGTHQVFQMAEEGKIRLDHTIPLILHGDAGRTHKKAPLEVFSFRAALGLDTEASDLVCSCARNAVYNGLAKSDPMAQRLNHKHNSYLTHFLIFAFPPKKYKKTPGLLFSLLECVSKNLRDACCDGVSVGGTVYHVAILGMAGDMEHHAKTGLLTRSYKNVGHKNSIPCCHECEAGGPHAPFEEVGTMPQWVSTIYRSPPWSETPPFKHIPFDAAGWDSGAASRFFKRDAFHIFRLGIGRNFAGSTIVLLCLEGVFDYDGDGGRGLDERLTRAWNSFSLWCDASHLRPAAMRSFSKEMLHMPNLGSFPWCGGKGSDTILVIKWLRFVATIHQNADPLATVFGLIIEACDNGLSFQCVYKHGIWLRPPCRHRIMCATKGFVQSYARLAHRSYLAGQQLYAMVPKLHAMDHFRIELALKHRNAYSCNPALYDCSMAEDFIGKVSRQSRRVSNVNIVENTLLAYKVKTRFVIKRFKKQKR
eukprot:Skav215640  [mRNA]  locus=scaffold736:247242:248783:- [translate_table: standard]